MIEVGLRIGNPEYGTCVHCRAKIERWTYLEGGIWSERTITAGDKQPWTHENTESVWCHTTQAEPQTSLVEGAYEAELTSFPVEPPELAAVMRVVCRRWGVWPADLFNMQNRTQHVVLARRVTWYITGAVFKLDASTTAAAFRCARTTTAAWMSSPASLYQRYKGARTLPRTIEELSQAAMTELAHIHTAASSP